MKFHFEAFDGSGTLVAGELEAVSVDDARRIVEARGVTPYAVRPSSILDVLVRDIDLGSLNKRVNDASLARLMRDLAVLIQAGVALDQALRIAQSTCEDKRLASIAARLLESILSGHSLPDAMGEIGSSFRPEYVKIVQAGDLGADLGGALEQLAELIDRRVEIRSKVRTALAYPILLIGLAGVSLAIVLGLLVPAITPIFAENGSSMPPIIAAMIQIREHGTAYAGLGAVAIAILVSLVLAMRRQPAGRIRLARLALGIPIFGRIARIREAARYTRTLAALIVAGVPPLQALEHACPLVHNDHTRRLIETAIEAIAAGATIRQAFDQTNALPLVARQLIGVGEETGRLPDMLMRATLILERQEQNLTTQTLAIVTPAITILVSGMIATIIISVMSAILSLNDLALQ